MWLFQFNCNTNLANTAYHSFFISNVFEVKLLAKNQSKLNFSLKKVMLLQCTTLADISIPSYRILKAGPLRFKQILNTLKIIILSHTRILYLICFASVLVIQIMDHQLKRRMPVSELCWKKNNGAQQARTSSL